MTISIFIARLIGPPIAMARFALLANPRIYHDKEFIRRIFLLAGRARVPSSG
jgi:hypothetical protein